MCVHACVRTYVCAWGGPKCQTGRGWECGLTGNVAVQMWNAAVAANTCSVPSDPVEEL